MGQYWYLYDLDGRTHIRPHFLKMWEIISNHYFDDAVALLAKPQGFTRSKPTIYKPKTSKPSSEASKTTSADADNDDNNPLAVPNLPPSAGLLSTIPMSLVVNIFKLLFTSRRNLPSFICLSMCNSDFFRVGHEIIQEYYMEVTPIWAGHRLVSFGDYAEYPDTPKGIFTPEETTELEEILDDARKAKARSNQEEPRSESTSGDSEVYTSVSEFLSGRSRGVTDVDRVGKNLRRPPCTFSNDGETLKLLEKLTPEFGPFTRQTRNMDQLLRNNTYYISPGSKAPEPWVLCNLTAREYVRTDAFAKDLSWGPWANFDQHYKINLAHCLTARVCWSSDPSMSMNPAYQGDMHRGKWAGHRFMVMPLSQLPSIGTQLVGLDWLEGNEKPSSWDISEWKDVSKEVIEEVTEILSKGVYGEEDWMENYQV